MRKGLKSSKNKDGISVIGNNALFAITMFL